MTIDLTSDFQAPWGEAVYGFAKMTVEEFSKVTSENDWYYELYKGRVLRTSVADEIHKEVLYCTSMVLGKYFIEQNIGFPLYSSYFELSIDDSNENVLCPDISYLLPGRLIEADVSTPFVKLSPDLVIEIASTDESHLGMSRKSQAYLTAGTKSVCILWPESQCAEVWNKDGTVFTRRMLDKTEILKIGAILPDFLFPVGMFFARQEDSEQS